MFLKVVLTTMAILAVGVAGTAGFAAAQGPELSPLDTSFTFQGRLTDGSTPANGIYDFRFILYDAESGGNQVGSTVSRDDIAISAGIITVALDFGSSSFAGQARWLETAVRPGSSIGVYTVLSPRQAVTAAPSALYSRAGPFWSLTGNSGTTPGTNFIGTADNQAFEVKVNGQRALRIEPASNSEYGFSPNLVAGNPANSVDSGVVGATIAGGGTSTYPNRASGVFATVGGGVRNTASGSVATVGGGYNNTASAEGATVGGGEGNTASGGVATADGGYNNTASAEGATVGGGLLNTASGNYATVPGGQSNTAAGLRSFAAGYRAQANHDGAFVWADSTDADFETFLEDTFRVRATNGSAFIAGNEDYGFRVENTGDGDGIRAFGHVSSGSEWAALFAYNDGSSPAIYANSGSGTYSGYFYDDIYVDGNCDGCTLVFVAQNAGDAALEVGDLVTASGIAPALGEGSEPVLLVRRADAAVAGVVGVVQSHAQIVASEKDGQTSQSADRAGGPAQPGDPLFIVVQGLAQVKVDADKGAIAAGQRLAATGLPGQRLAATGLPGHARALKTVQVEGVTIEESAPTIGVALESLDAGQGMLWVLVTLR